MENLEANQELFYSLNLGAKSGARFYEQGAGKVQQRIEDQDEKLLKLLQSKRSS